MTKVESSGSDASANRNQQRKEKHRIRQKKEKIKPQLKVVVRHLPPTMTEGEFLKQIELPEHDAFYYSAPDWSLGNCASCRAYVTLKRYDDVFLFRDRFDGYVFVDSKGAEYTAIVEFAPFQGLLKNRSRRNDTKANTIENESHYQQFLAKLQEEREAVAKGSDVKLEFSLERKKEEITSTPLLQYLAMKKEKRREEAKKRSDDKRRQREEEKERRRQQQTQVKKILSGQGSKGSSSGGGTGASIKGKEGSAPAGEHKNSRARRKAGREQKRKEQREKALLKMEGTGKADIAATEIPAVVEEKPSQGPKKYSEKRERERERNRNRKEKEKQKPSPEPKPDPPTPAAETAPAPAEESQPKQKSKDEQISDTVLNFIRSVASVKEFVPKHKQKDQAKPDTAATNDKNEIFEIQKSSSNDSNSDAKGNFDKEKSQEAKDRKDAAFKTSESDLSSKREEAERKRQEERRIRNKDRPSIAIYQPKPRQRTSEETDPNSAGRKDSRSNSDCEKPKKDEVRQKKVSRYSERRSERRALASFNKSKQHELSDDAAKVLSKSPSLEDPPSPDDTLEKKISKDDPEEPVVNKEAAENQDP